MVAIGFKQSNCRLFALFITRRYEKAIAIYFFFPFLPFFFHSN
jgi:hypothetical protein